MVELEEAIRSEEPIAKVNENEESIGGKCQEECISCIINSRFHLKFNNSPDIQHVIIILFLANTYQGAGEGRSILS